MTEDSPNSGRYTLDPRFTDPARIKKERERARDLKQTAWWKQKLQPGLCHYCQKKFKASDLTMDHIVPLARGGESVKSNLVPACKACNASKKLSTPAEDAFAELEREKALRASFESSFDPALDPGETEDS